MDVAGEEHTDEEWPLSRMNPFPPYTSCFTLSAVLHAENDKFLQAG